MAGGGSGGHVIPALAVARELRARGHAVRFIGTRRGMEAKLVPPAGFPIEWIEIGGLKRVGLRKTARDAGAASLERVAGVAHASPRCSRRGVFDGRIRGRAGVAGGDLRNRIPVIVMEPNAVPGFTHRRLARFVARALVSFPETARWFPKGRVEVAGLPVREEFFAVAQTPPPALGASRSPF